MNESRHPIDDLFREGLEGQHFEAPAHVWERIDQKRTPLYKLANNFRQNYRFYLSVVAGLALLSSFALWLLSDEIPGNQVAQADPAAISITEDVAPANPNPRAEAQLFVAQPEASKPAMSIPTTQAAPNHQPIQPVAAEQPENTKADDPIINEQPIEAETPKKETADKPAKEESALPSPGSAAPKPSVVPPVTEKGQDKNSETPVETKEVAPKAPESKPVTEPQTAEAKPEGNVQPEEANNSNKNAQPPLSRPWSLEFAGSYDFVTRQVSNADPLYMQTRKDAERIKSAFTFQTRLGYQIKPGITLKTGLSYSRVNEVIQFEDPYIEQEISERQETGWVVDPINGPRQITYTVKDTQDVTRYRTVNAPNSYTFIDLPLMIQYDFMQSNRWTFGASAGMLINLKFGQYGHTLHSNAVDVINLGTDMNPFRTRASVDLMLNFSAAYKLNDNLDILIEPAARFGTGSLMRENFGATQRYNRYSLYTGLRYRFN